MRWYSLHEKRLAPNLLQLGASFFGGGGTSCRICHSCDKPAGRANREPVGTTDPILTGRITQQAAVSLVSFTGLRKPPPVPLGGTISAFALIQSDQLWMRHEKG